MMKNVRCLLLLSCIVIAVSCEKKSKVADVPLDSTALTYSILSTLPHDDKAFTEGLVFYGTKLLESTGLNNQSWIAEGTTSSGSYDKKVILDGRYFGEGITVINNKIYQLTYQEKTGFIYDADNYKKIGEFTYNTEGWGLTHNGENLIMSDGTEKLYFLDTLNFKVVRTLAVTDGNVKVKSLNELEFVNGYIFANVYETSSIVKIDVTTGKIVGHLDFSTLNAEIKRMYPNTDVFNGIAYDKKEDAFVITGKFWPKSYLIKIH